MAKIFPRVAAVRSEAKKGARALANTSSCARPLVWGRAVCWVDAPELAP